MRSETTRVPPMTAVATNISPKLPSAEPTLAALLHRLGDIDPVRVLVRPAPGMATETDLIQSLEHDGRRCELADGVLVEKAIGWMESRLAVVLILLLESYLEDHDIGFVLGSDAPHRLQPELVRLPDVSFVRYGSVPVEQRSCEPIANWVPDLAVEILSPSNRPQEMERKLIEYFAAGVQRVWYVDPATRQVRDYHAADSLTVLSEDQILDGGELLPGFQISIRDWFRRAERALRGGPT